MKLRKLLAISSLAIFTFAFSMTGSTTYADDTNVWDFNCTGKQQVFTAPHTGTYKLEVWGGQGGSKNNNGGKGGYAGGKVKLTQGESIYVYVGACPNITTIWNGGGHSVYSGGDATDIRINGTSLNDRVIVAGGGGGTGCGPSQTWNYIGGVGGGLTGGNGTGPSYYIGYGGSQTSGGSRGDRIENNWYNESGSFGQGGNSSSDSWGGAGGGGYYGGGAGECGEYEDGGGGGGSSYIGGVLDGYTVSGTNVGNGRAKITYVQNYANGIVINKRADDLEVGETDKLTALVTPSNASVKTVKWTSSDPSIVTVDDNGNITAVKAGTTIITATVQDGRNLHGQCRVCVTN